MCVFILLNGYQLLLQKLHEILLFQFVQVGILATQSALFCQLSQCRHRHVAIIQMNF